MPGAIEDPSWHHYPDTILELGAPDVLRIDLREELTPDIHRCLRERGLAEPFAVITAANPGGRIVTDEENRARVARLDRVVERRGCYRATADGVSVDGLHREAGVAVPLSIGEAAELARRFEQSAFFYFDGTAFWLVGAMLEAPPMRLPLR